MATTNRPSLSRLDQTILLAHVLVAAAAGIVAFIGANDPEFGSLQRVVVVLLIGLWAGGILAMAVLARLIPNQWGRALLLVAGPFIGIVLLVAGTMR